MDSPTESKDETMLAESKDETMHTESKDETMLAESKDETMLTESKDETMLAESKDETMLTKSKDETKFSPILTFERKSGSHKLDLVGFKTLGTDGKFHHNDTLQKIVISAFLAFSNTYGLLLPQMKVIDNHRRRELSNVDFVADLIGSIVSISMKKKQTTWRFPEAHFKFIARCRKLTRRLSKLAEPMSPFQKHLVWSVGKSAFLELAEKRSAPSLLVEALAERLRQRLFERMETRHVNFPFCVAPTFIHTSVFHPNILGGDTMDLKLNVPVLTRLSAGSWTKAQLWRFMVEIWSALKHLHRSGLFHGKLSEESVLVTGSGRAVLCDFGECVDISKSQLLDGTHKDDRDFYDLVMHVFHDLSPKQITPIFDSIYSCRD